MDGALQARPGVQLMSWLPINNSRHSPLSQLAGLLPIWGKKSQWVSFIRVTTRGSKTITARGLNKEVRTEWSSPGYPIGNIPTHHYSPGEGPADKAPPANLHILSPIPPQHSTRQLPATFEDEVQSCQQKKLTMLDNMSKNHNHNSCDCCIVLIRVQIDNIQ